MLMLDGRETAVHLTAPTIVGRADRNGWFDLTLLADNGGQVLLHNALRLSAKFHQPPDRGVTDHIYPNTVVLNAERLRKDGRVGAISFSAAKLGVFFNYKHIEAQHLFYADKVDRDGLRRLRRGNRGPHDFFNPSEVYLVHKPVQILRFRVADRTYMIGSRTSTKGMGWNSVVLRADPIASIAFDHPVDLDAAMNRVFEWLCFFSQIAMEPILPDALQAAGRSGPRQLDAAIYLPSLDGRPPTPDSPFDLHPGGSPFSRWSERKALTTLMRDWLSRQEERNVFRGYLSRVIDQSQTESSIDGIVSLCAAVDSLAELRTPNGVTKAQVSFLAAAAAEEATRQQIAVDERRLNGVLGMLQSEPLRARLALLVNAIAHGVSPQDADLLVSTAIELRRVGAHGVSLAEARMPRILPTLNGLAALCALYDLMSCGAPPETSAGVRLPAVGRASEMAMMLRTFSA